MAISEIEELEDELNEIEAYLIYLCSEVEIDHPDNEYNKMCLSNADRRKRFVESRLKELKLHKEKYNG
jgi:dynactin complex subunit